MSIPWTPGRRNAFIMSVLRSGTRRWPAKWDILEDAKTEKKINPKTGRLAQMYKCASCTEEYTSKEVEVDHIDPVVPISGFISWDNVIERIFCTADKLQVLCTTCHKKKSKIENKHRKDLANSSTS